MVAMSCLRGFRPAYAMVGRRLDRCRRPTMAVCTHDLQQQRRQHQFHGGRDIGGGVWRRVFDASFRARPSGDPIVIQLFVYLDAWWNAHAYWTALLIVLIARGPGVILLERLIFRK